MVDVRLGPFLIKDLKHSTHFQATFLVKGSLELKQIFKELKLWKEALSLSAGSSDVGLLV